MDRELEEGTRRKAMRYMREGHDLAIMDGRIVEGDRGYYPKEEAYETLKRWTGQDFGYDTGAWREWFEKHANELSNDSYIQAARAVLGPPDPDRDVDDPEELDRLQAEIEEIRRRTAER
jgi:hypothetical protein